MTFLVHLKNELLEISARKWRYVLYLVAVILAVGLAGSLLVRTPPLKVVVFTQGFNTIEDGDGLRARITVALRQFDDIEVLTENAPLEAESLRGLDAVVGLGMERGSFKMLLNEAAAPQLDLRLISVPISLSLSAGFLFSDGGQILDALGIENIRSKASGPSPDRGAALPRSNRTLFVPRVIALLAIFAPFLVVLDSYVAQFNSRILHMRLATAGGGFASMAWSKALVAILVGLCVLLSALMAANALFGLAPAGGLATVLLVFAMGAVASASLGLIISMLTRPSRQIFGTIVGYFFLLITFSGFILPVAAGENFIQIGSYASALKYPLAVLENWMVQGQIPDIGQMVVALWSWPQTRIVPEPKIVEFLSFLALCVVSAAGAGIAIFRAARRL